MKRAAVSRPFITKATRKKRLIWAREHVKWTEAQWNNVLFCDETCIRPLYNVKRTVFKQRTEGFIQELTQPALAHGGGVGVQAWGMVSGKGLRHFVFYDPPLCGAKYAGVFPPLSFQRLSTSFHQHLNNQTELLHWFATSLFRSRTTTAKRRRGGLQLLQDNATCTAFYKIDQSVINNLVRSMHNRCQAVIASKGGPTKY